MKRRTCSLAAMGLFAFAGSAVTVNAAEPPAEIVELSTPMAEASAIPASVARTADDTAAVIIPEPPREAPPVVAAKPTAAVLVAMKEAKADPVNKPAAPKEVVDASFEVKTAEVKAPPAVEPPKPAAKVIVEAPPPEPAPVVVRTVYYKPAVVRRTWDYDAMTEEANGCGSGG